VSHTNREYKLEKYVEVMRLHVTDSVFDDVLLHWAAVPRWKCYTVHLLHEKSLLLLSEHIRRRRLQIIATY
jgi:hypothetical protein